MFILSGQESKIYELIRSGIQPSEIAKMAEYRKISSLYTVVERLTTLGFLKKKKLENRTNHYQPLISEYEIIENKGLRLRSRKKQIELKPVILTLDEPYGNFQATKEQQKRIFELCMSGKKTSVISSELNLPRYIINREIINLGIKQD